MAFACHVVNYINANVSVDMAELIAMVKKLYCIVLFFILNFRVKFADLEKC